MPILKFTITDKDEIVLEKFRIEDISNDSRTHLLDKKTFLKPEYKIDENIYLVLNDMFFKMSKFFNKSNIPIDAMLIKYENKSIIIVPSRSYIFWKGRSVEPLEYKIIDNEINIMKLLSL